MPRFWLRPKPMQLVESTVGSTSFRTQYGDRIVLVVNGSARVDAPALELSDHSIEGEVQLFLMRKVPR